MPITLNGHPINFRRKVPVKVRAPTKCDQIILDNLPLGWKGSTADVFRVVVESGTYYTIGTVSSSMAHLKQRGNFTLTFNPSQWRRVA